MDDSAKYLIHAEVTAHGVVERSDVVGAIFGQTEGLLGDELDLRYLQNSSKVGRIDVDVESEGGRSFGSLTIATSLDKVETSVLAASLETIDRVGPCRANLRVIDIEDVRSAKRRQVVERAKELVAESFDDSAITSHDILEEVRQTLRVEDVTEYEGLPAGPRVADGDAVIVVEGRSDVVQLLQYGIKNAIAVEGTNVPDVVAELTRERTTTAFLDGDRGGDLILKELAQVGDVDYVALAPPGKGVEDLSRRGVLKALREKVSYRLIADEEMPTQALVEQTSSTDGGAISTEGDIENASAPAVEDDSSYEETDLAATATSGGRVDAGGEPGSEEGAELEFEEGAGLETKTGAEIGSEADEPSGETPADGVDAAETTEAEAPDIRDDEGDDAPTGLEDEVEVATLHGHVRAVIEEDAGAVRLLDDEFGVLVEKPAEEAFEAIEEADEAPSTVVLDGELTQRVLDVAAQRGVPQVFARETGDFVKKPASVRVLTAEQLLVD